MKFRLPAVAALASVLLLAACGGETVGPTPTVPAQATMAIEPTPELRATETEVTPTTGEAAPSPVGEQTVAPTVVANTTEEPSNEGALELVPVQIETSDSTRQGAFQRERTINLPPGFGIRVYAAGLDGVRWLGLSPDGTVYATVRGESRVVTLPDKDRDGVADEVKLFADDILAVHGIAFKDKGVYVANETDIYRLEDTDNDGKADKRDLLASDLPSGGGHSTRTLAFGPDGKLYVSAGSSCNVCEESDPKRAAVSLYSAEGVFEKVYAEGLRNAVGIEFHPSTNELWATNNGRDQLGDNTPAEAIYKVEEGKHYGWPYCYPLNGKILPDPNVPPAGGFCEKVEKPAVEMQAHSAPLGLAFYAGENVPEQFRGDMLVAFHGSWNRSEPTGYKVVRIRFAGNQPDTGAGEMLVEDFATGWFEGDDWGRPVDVLTLPDGTLLLTDDKANAVYQIYYKENSGP